MAKAPYTLQQLKTFTDFMKTKMLMKEKCI